MDAGLLREFPGLFLDAAVMFLEHILKESGVKGSTFASLRRSLEVMVEEHKLSCADVIVAMIFMHRLKHAAPAALSTAPSADVTLRSATRLAKQFLHHTDNLEHASPDDQLLHKILGDLAHEERQLANQLAFSVFVDVACFSKWKNCIEQKVLKLKTHLERQQLLLDQRKAAEAHKHLHQLDLTPKLLHGAEGVKGRVEKHPLTVANVQHLGHQIQKNLHVREWVTQQMLHQHLPLPSPSPSSTSSSNPSSSNPSSSSITPSLPLSLPPPSSSSSSSATSSSVTPPSLSFTPSSSSSASAPTLLLRNPFPPNHNPNGNNPLLQAAKILGGNQAPS